MERLHSVDSPINAATQSGSQDINRHVPVGFSKAALGSSVFLSRMPSRRLVNYMTKKFHYLNISCALLHAALG